MATGRPRRSGPAGSRCGRLRPSRSRPGQRPGDRKAVPGVADAGQPLAAGAGGAAAGDRSGVRGNRRFLGRAVCYLAAEAGVRQFLDIGTGLPSAHNTHLRASRSALQTTARLAALPGPPVRGLR